MGYLLFFLLCIFYAIPAILIIISLFRKREDRIIILIVGVVFSFGFYILPTNRVDIVIVGAFILFGSLYFFSLRPRLEKKREDNIFDSRVLGFIDGLYLSDVHFGCSVSEMRHYVKFRLAEAHQLPGNQFLIEYTTAQGRTYCSHTGNHDHMLFALLCIAEYAQASGNANLASWCEARMRSAETALAFY